MTPGIRSTLALAGTALALALAACGGSTNNDADIGGTLSGLASGTTVTLANNGADTLVLSADGSFQFAQTISSGNAYDVTVVTQPTGQICTVDSGSGSVDSNGDSVDSVNVSCVATASLLGTVTGLNAGAGVTLSNGEVLLPIAANGAFSFPGLLSTGTTYNVTVATQPVGQTCTVLNGSGTITSDALIPITVTCS